ncbi:hypothetical protein IT575_05375 [bacterium]|nr:hypothetical protein [bacterium]
MIVDSIEEYLALEPQKFRDCRSMTLEWDSDTEKASSSPVNLAMEYVCLGGTSRLLLTFRGVRQLKIHSAEVSIVKFGLLDIEPASDMQWEGVSYYVAEVEDELSFYCESFSAELRQSPAQSLS